MASSINAALTPSQVIYRINRAPIETDVYKITREYLSALGQEPAPKSLQKALEVADVAFRRIGDVNQRLTLVDKIHELGEQDEGYRQLRFLPCFPPYENDDYGGSRVSMGEFRKYVRPIVTPIISAMSELWPERVDHSVTYHDLYLRSPDTSFFAKEVMQKFQSMGLVDFSIFSTYDREAPNKTRIIEFILMKKNPNKIKTKKLFQELEATAWPHSFFNNANLMYWAFN